MLEQLDLFESACREDLEPKLTDQDLQAMFEKKNKQKLLTPRQWRLLDLIKHNSLVEHRKTTQKEVCEKIDTYVYDTDEKTHDHCVAIWGDIKDINLSYETDKLIISKNFEYWVGNEEETKTFIDKLWSDLEPRLTRYWAYLKKVSRNNQGIFIDRKGNVIDQDSSAREYIESYGKSRIS